MFYTPGAQIAKKRPVQACTGPVTYTGQAEVKQEIDVTIAAAGIDDVFLTSTAPASLEVYRHNRFYKSDEDYVYALAEAMRAEYEAIAAAGLILQVDDAWLPALWDRIGIGMGLACVPRPLRDADRGAQSRAAQCRRKIACAIICAGAVGTARTPTISGWKKSSI